MNDLQRILEALSALKRRERRLLLLRALGVLLATLLLLWLGAMGAAGAGIDRSSARMLVIPALFLLFGGAAWWLRSGCLLYTSPSPRDS